MEDRRELGVALSAAGWLAALGLCLAWGCSAPNQGPPKLARQTPAAPRSGAPPTPSAAPVSGSAATSQVSLGAEVQVTLERLQEAIRVRIRPPQGWQLAEGRGATWLPPAQPDPDQMEVSLKLSVECMGQCGAPAIVRNLAELRSKLARPQVTYTDGSISATSRREIARSVKTQLGWALLQRELFDAQDLERGRGRWHERFLVVNVSHREQDGFFVLCEGVGLPAREQAFADAMFAACDTVVIMEVSRLGDAAD